MTNSYTRSSTLTIINAKHLASRVASDLRQVRLFHGFPSDDKILEYIQELVILMLNGCFKSVKNGFWVFFLEYKAQFGKIESVDDDSGDVSSTAKTNEAEWTSFLTASYSHLSPQRQKEIKESLPFQRDSGVESKLGLGKLSNDKFYSSGSGAIQRSSYN